MSQRAKDLSERLRTFNTEVMEFVEKCSEEDWRKKCREEDWTLGVVARHIGAGHYEALDFARMIIAGEKLPAFTMDEINQRANNHAKEHADCTRPEVLEILRKNGATLTDYVAKLSDDELDRTGYLPLLEKEITAQNILELVILQSGGDHFASMKSAMGE